MDRPQKHLARQEVSSTPSYRKAKKIKTDRFIPSKTSPMNFKLGKIFSESGGSEPSHYEFQIRSILSQPCPASELNSAGPDLPGSGTVSPNASFGSKSKVLFFGQPQAAKAPPAEAAAAPRLFEARETRILDAPMIPDSFYFNLLSMSAAGVLAVGLNSFLQLFNASTNQISTLHVDKQSTICAVRFSHRAGHLIAHATTAGSLKVSDAQAASVLRSFSRERDRVVAVDWGGPLLASGSKTGRVLLRDLRSRAAAGSIENGHEGEVCTLRFCPQAPEQLLSGGNDDRVLLFDLRSSGRPLCRVEAHRAAVKALAWHPRRRGVFASGGGAADHRLVLTDANSGRPVRSLALGAQVCNLEFTADDLAAVSTGFPANSLLLVDTAGGSVVHSFAGHELRLLYMTINAERTVAVTGSPDATIRFWDVADKHARRRPPDPPASLADQLSRALR